MTIDQIIPAEFYLHEFKNASKGCIIENLMKLYSICLYIRDLGIDFTIIKGWQNISSYHYIGKAIDIELSLQDFYTLKYYSSKLTDPSSRTLFGVKAISPINVDKPILCQLYLTSLSCSSCNFRDFILYLDTFIHVF